LNEWGEITILLYDEIRQSTKSKVEKKEY